MAVEKKSIWGNVRNHQLKRMSHAEERWWWGDPRTLHHKTPHLRREFSFHTSKDKQTPVSNPHPTPRM